MNLIKILALVVAITIVAGISYSYPHSCSAVVYPSQTLPPVTANDGTGPLADGAAVYKTKCAVCHGFDGSGDVPAGRNMKVMDLRSAEVQKKSDARLSAIISNGKGKMPPYGKSLSRADIVALVAFIRTLK
jgi:mono/diheme cytochrome c family protein